MKQIKHPWQRLLNETTISFNAFATYRDLGPDRSYSKVLKTLGKKPSYKRQIQKWATDFEWVKRAALYDDSKDDEKLKHASEGIKELHEYAISRSREVIDELVRINLNMSWAEPQRLKSIELYLKTIGVINS